MNSLVLSTKCFRCIAAPSPVSPLIGSKLVIGVELDAGGQRHFIAKSISPKSLMIKGKNFVCGVMMRVDDPLRKLHRLERQLLTISCKKQREAHKLVRGLAESWELTQKELEQTLRMEAKASIQD